MAGRDDIIFVGFGQGVAAVGTVVAANAKQEPQTEKAESAEHNVQE